MSFSEQYIVESRILLKTYQDALFCLKQSEEKRYFWSRFNSGRESLLENIRIQSKIKAYDEITKNNPLFKEGDVKMEQDEMINYESTRRNLNEKYKKIFQFSDWIFRKYFKEFDKFDFDAEENTMDDFHKIMDDGLERLEKDVRDAKNDK